MKPYNGKNVSLLVWVTQLGLSVAVPPAAFVLLARWLQSAFGLGDWVFWTGLGLGILGAIGGLRSALRAMSRLAQDKNDTPPPVSFNEHD